ncbi:MAG: transposase [Chitinophagales bacterium]|nr:transposase [Chitinophagales bacterium]
MYFVSFATVHWIDLFTRTDYCEVLIESLKYCQKEKGLIVYAWVIMPNHVHLIIGTNDKPMQDILRDFKSFTSRTLKEKISSHPQESRKDWLINAFTKAGKLNPNNNDWQLWQQHNHPIELWDNYMRIQKLDYLHNNPVKARYVEEAEHWIWSSAKDYCGKKGILDVVLIE